MKSYSFCTIAVICAVAGPASAASLTIPNSFVSGEAARAAEVNENFNAVKTEVDDNNARILQNAAAIGFKLDSLDGGSCGAGESMRGINASGGPICGTDANTLYSNGTGLDLTGNVFSINPAVTQQRVDAGTPCNPGQSIRLIKEDGSVDCEEDTDTTYTAGTGMQLDGTEFRPADGFVSVPYSAFVATNVSRTDAEALQAINDINNGAVFGSVGLLTVANTRILVSNADHPQLQVCQLSPQLSTSGAYTFFVNNGSANCDAFAPLNLPHNATISSLSCKVFDDSANNSLTARLYRVPLTGTGSTQELILESNTSVPGVSTPQQIVATNPNPAVHLVENNNYAYHLQMIWETSALGPNFRVYGCSVGYNYI